MTSLKRKSENKSCKIKYSALIELEKGVSAKDIATQYGVPKSTLSTWKKNKTKIFEQYNSGKLSKRIKPEKYDLVNKAVYRWLLMIRGKNIPISGPMLKEKGVEFANALGVQSFQASEGWLTKWKSRYGISFKSIVGELISVTEEMTAPWTKTTLQSILSRYPLENIFNADEFGLFYQCLPNKTLHLKGEKCSGGKHSKLRITGLAAGNAFGERLPMFTIGKSYKPRCFKGVKTLPCRYRAQKKSWMNAELFEEWLHELDSKLACSKRNIAMIIDNCTAHPHIYNLEWIELVFVPQNTTSHTQPMDQGIIRALKAKYRSLVIHKLIKALEKKESVPKFSLITAMFMLKKAWDDVSNTTFTNCFRKSGISQNDDKAMNDDEDPFKELNTDFVSLKERFSDQIEDGVLFNDYLDFDSDLSTSNSQFTTADIIAEVTKKENEQEDDVDDDAEDEIKKPTNDEVQVAISILENFSLFSSSGDEIMKSVKSINDIFEKECVRKQTSL